MSLKESVRALRDGTALGKGEVLVFLHGYNVTFGDALRRTAQLAFDLNFEGAPILYSWPAAGNKLDYVRDTELSGYTIDSFRDFLKLVRTELGADTVHVIAHSMGSKVLVSALQRLEEIDNAASMRHIVFAAPDIDAKTFPTLAEAFKENANRVTVYASTLDSVLRWSSFAHGLHERLGSSIQPYTSVDTIDASGACPAADKYCHALLASPLVLKDLNALLRHDDPPEKRSLTWRQSDNDLPYWELRKE